MKKETQSVNIRKSGNAYIIEIQDLFVQNCPPIILAVTKGELEKIVLYGQKILDELVN